MDENDDWRKAEKEYKKVGIAFIWDKQAGDEVNSALKLKAVEIPRMFGETEKVSFEATYHINKIDKQMQYFDKVSEEFFWKCLTFNLEKFRLCDHFGP